MKYLIPFLFFFFLTLNSFSQKVYSSNSKYDADVKVYVANSKYDADLWVYKVDSKYSTGNNEGWWFFTDSKYDADKKIWFSDSKYDADLIIYFVDSKYSAGWNKKEKQHLMYWKKSLMQPNKLEIVSVYYIKAIGWKQTGIKN